MNEQFFTLALKAMDFQGAVDTDTELKLTNSELQKFAELIVWECVWIMYHHHALHKNGEYKFTDSLDAAKTHFGVD